MKIYISPSACKDLTNIPVDTLIAEYSDSHEGKNVLIELRVVQETKYLFGENLYDEKDIAPNFIKNSKARTRTVIPITLKRLEFICKSENHEYQVICDEDISEWTEEYLASQMELIARWVAKTNYSVT